MIVRMVHYSRLLGHKVTRSVITHFTTKIDPLNQK
jgi:hypothetical protein